MELDDFVVFDAHTFICPYCDSSKLTHDILLIEGEDTIVTSCTNCEQIWIMPTPEEK